MNLSAEASAFTETLVSVVRLQRHLAARVIISTQEPTISTALLNLCSLTIVHHFMSPEWLRTLHHHLASAADSLFSAKLTAVACPKRQNREHEESESGSTLLFNRIVHLQVGEALLFSPSAIVGANIQQDGNVDYHCLGAKHLTIRIQSQLTSDGGKSVLAH